MGWSTVETSPNGRDKESKKGVWGGGVLWIECSQKTPRNIGHMKKFGVLSKIGKLVEDMLECDLCLLEGPLKLLRIEKVTGHKKVQE